MTDSITQSRPSGPSLLTTLRHSATFKEILVQPWTYVTGGVLLAIIATALLEATGKPWGVTTTLTYWGAWAWGLVGGDPHGWAYFKEASPGFNAPGLTLINDPGTLINIGLIFGALTATLLASQFKIKQIKSNRQVVAAILGGLLMGFGARLSFGCNIGALFSGIPAMSLHGWVFMVFIFVGALIGSKLLVTFFIGAPSLTSATPAPAAVASVQAAPAASSSGGIKRIPRVRVEKKENVVQLPLGIALVIGLGIVGTYYGVVQKAPLLAIFWIIGIALGFVLQRARFCFTAALRDPCLTGGTSITKAVVIALAVATVLVSALQLGAYVKAGSLEAAMKVGSMAPVGIYTAIGATLFGIGAVISGGCASGTLMRVGEGFLQQWLVLPFFCIGSAIGAATWPIWRDLFGVNMKGAVYLPNVLGGFAPALIAQFVALFCVWLLADWWSKRPRA